jgi:phosphoserine phosphatase
VTAPSVSKGLALATLARHLGVAREHVMAIGAQDNDVSMLQWAGLGLAMGNAPRSVHAIADAVIPPPLRKTAWPGRSVSISSAKRRLRADKMPKLHYS